MDITTLFQAFSGVAVGVAEPRHCPLAHPSPFLLALAIKLEQYCLVVKTIDLRASLPEVQILVLPLDDCVTLKNSLNLSGS